MRFLAVAIWMTLVALSAFGAEGEAELFKSATDAFKDKFYERAEQQFGEFATRFPASTNLGLAILYQAQGRHLQKRHDSAIELLTNHLERAGSLADQYVFIQAEALAAKGDHAPAADRFGELARQYTDSTLRLQASYLQAFSHFQLKDYARTLELLRDPEGTFQLLARAAPQDRFSFSGQLLLAEALLATGDLGAGRETAAGAPAIADRPDLDWERHDLLARLEFASTNPAAALPHLTNAVAAASAAQRPRLQAQSWNLEAEVYRKLNQPASAIAAYEKIAAADVLSIDQRRLAVLKTVEQHSSAGAVPDAISRLESYLGANTNEPAADFLRVKAGELWIDQFRRLAGTNPRPVPQMTNALAQARSHLNTVLTRFTNSVHLGRAWLNLGWSFWEEGSVFNAPLRIQDSESAFRTASEKLTRSDDQALAIFKMADAEFYLGKRGAALTNYLAVVKNFGDLPQVRNALFQRTYAQLVRASVELGDLAGAREHLAELRRGFPNSPLAEESIFLYGEALSLTGKRPEARTVFQDFLTNYPSSNLAPEVRFADARTHAGEGDFTGAIQKHEQWLTAFPTNQLRPEIEFHRGVLLDKAGQATNALAAFTNFVAHYPAHGLAPAAQVWVADYFFSREQWHLAEANYQRVFQNSNWVNNPLAYQSRIAAARTAFMRQGYDDARSYLTNLVNDPKCPPEFQPEAWFALGDVFLEEPITGSTNALNNFIQGAAVFDRIHSQYPNHPLAIPALAKKGDCLFQLASQTNYVGSYNDAARAYSNVLSAPVTAAPVKARNQAEVGLAMVLEKMAHGKAGAEREELLKQSLNHLLDVVYGRNSNGQRPDPHYLKLAGREAGRLAEALGNSEAALDLYKRLVREAPSLRTVWEARIAAVQQRLDRQSALN